MTPRSKQAHVDSKLVFLAPTAEVWERVCVQLKARMDYEVFQSWFRRLTFKEAASGIVHLTVPTPFLRHWLKKHYSHIILELWQAECPSVTGIDISISSTTRARAAHSVELPERKVVQRIPLSQFAKPTASDKSVAEQVEPKLPPVAISLEHVRAFVMRHYKMSGDDINSTRRLPELVKYRRNGMYLAKMLTPASFEEIAKQFGNRKVQTARNAVDEVRVKMSSNKTFAAEIEMLIRVIRAEASVMG